MQGWKIALATGVFFPPAMSLTIRSLCMSLNLLAMAAMPAFAQQDRLTEGDWREPLPFGQTPLQAESIQDRGDNQLAMPPEIPDTEVHIMPDMGQADIRIGSVLIESSTKIDYAIFEEAIEPFLGLDATREDLARLAQEIASAARATGVVLADAHIPPQDVELGIVRVVLTIAAIDAVRIEGSSNRALFEVLEPLVGQTSFQQEMDRRLTLASDIPGIIVKSAEIASEHGRRVLVVHAEDRPSSRGQFTLDNFGSSRVGPLRGRLQLSATAVFDDSDALSAMFQTNPIDEQELIAASLGYSVSLGNNGTRVFVAAGGSKSRIEPGTFYGARDARSEYIAAGATRTLRRSRTTNLWFETQLDYLRVQQEIEEARIQADSIAALSATLRGSLKTRNGWMRAGAQVRQGLDILGANSPGDVLSSRYDADGQFTSLRVWTSWDGKLNENTTLNLTLLSQIATEPLLASEEIGIGGPQFGRAFDFYQVSGDQGVLASAELGYVLKDPLDWLDSLQPYIFVDGGHVENLDGGYGGGSLISGGAGLRAQFGTFGLQVETAAPLSRSTPNLTSDNPVVNFQLGLGF